MCLYSKYISTAGETVMLAVLVRWYFGPSQPQRITSRPKTMFNLSAIYSALKLSNQKLSKNHKISPDTNLHKKKKCSQKYTNIKYNFFLELVPSVLALLKKKAKKAHNTRTRWYRGPFRRFINTRFKKKKKKECWLCRC